MKLLIITQKVDVNDPILGFFHGWIEELSKHCESIVVICLYEGKYHLPENVRVLSLGKEKGESRMKYLWNFYEYIWKELENYDKVFVHMNQEYILLGGILWKLFERDIFMWRNHHAGSILTDIAAAFCKKVFCTSKYSYTAKYKNIEIMPIGINIEKFKPLESVQRTPQSILFLGRISPVKRPDLFIDAIIKLNENNSQIIASIYGNPLPQDRIYYEGLKVKALNYVDFYKGVSNDETISIYSAHEIFVNLSSSGMYDKTIFEAMACGCLILASNENLRGKINDDFIFRQGDREELIHKLEKLLSYSLEDKQKAVKDLRKFSEEHSLKKLGDKLFEEIN